MLRDDSPDRADRTEGARDATVRRDPRPTPDPDPDAPPPPPDPAVVAAEARASLKTLEETEARALAALFRTRSEVAAALLQEGLVPETRLRLAEMEEELNKAARGHPAALEEAGERVKLLVRALAEAGRIPGSRVEKAARAVGAAVAARTWFTSRLRHATTRVEEPPKTGRPLRAAAETPEGRLAELTRINRAVLKTRETRLSGERAALDTLLGADPPDGPQTLSFRLRRLIALARLHEIPFDRARAEADRLLENAALGATDRAALEALAGLLDWYGSELLDELYVD